jgi:hypothetical protein
MVLQVMRLERKLPTSGVLAIKKNLGDNNDEFLDKDDLVRNKLDLFGKTHVYAHVYKLAIKLINLW